MQVKPLILYFFLLELRILFNFGPNTTYKQGGFFKTLLKKNLKFVLTRVNYIIAFNLCFGLLLAKVNLILKKLDYIKNALVAYGFGYIKIVYTLLIKVIALYI